MSEIKLSSNNVSGGKGIYLAFQIEGGNVFKRRLQAMAYLVKNFTVPFNKVSDMLLELIDLNFENRGKTLQAPWKKRKKEYPWPILNHTGLMRRSFIANVRPVSLTIWNDTSYFKYHQSRTARKKPKNGTGLPRRIMLKLTNQMKEGVVREFQKEVLRELRKAGGLYGRVD